MSFITAIGTATPQHVSGQSELADFMIRAMQLDEDNAKKLQIIFRASGISHRASVISDYGKKDNFTFYPNAKNFEPFPTTKKRNDVYREHAIELSLKAVENALASLPGFETKTITHLITVSCTGFYAPGLDIDLINRLNLSANTHRMCINFMGCYAALSALKAADAFCKADPSSNVLIVCTELCSLHFQKEATDDNFLANALFGDGSAAVLMEGTTAQRKRIFPTLFESKLVQNGSAHMAWDVGDFGFEMRLSTYVPDILEKHIHTFCSEMLAKQDKSIEELKYASVHPGGKKILAAVEKALNLPKEMNGGAYRILKNHGNMSSPTVLFVLKEIFEQLSFEDNNEEIIGFAFGPGLTLEGVLFKIEMD